VYDQSDVVELDEVEGTEARRNVKRFRGGLVFKAHRRLYHSTVGLRVGQEREEVI